MNPFATIAVVVVIAVGHCIPRQCWTKADLEVVCIDHSLCSCPSVCSAALMVAVRATCLDDNMPIRQPNWSEKITTPLMIQERVWCWGSVFNLALPSAL